VKILAISRQLSVAQCQPVLCSVGWVYDITIAPNWESPISNRRAFYVRRNDTL